MKRWLIVSAVLVATVAVTFVVTRGTGGKTVTQRVSQYGGSVDKRLIPVFHARNVPYPPTRLVLIGFKEERVLEVWAAGNDGGYRFIRSYPILAASGKPGPKLRQGDGQVPEGIYHIESLNPNSLYHLSLRVSYPNDFDRQQARHDDRTDLGGDIMIHGGAGSSGCLAVGDEAAEDLFVLAAKTGPSRITVILSPMDFRRREFSDHGPQPGWVPSLYADIKTALQAFAVKEGTNS